MPNPLTGDFDAILQVGGRTLNRLLGTMHQNAGTSKNLPTFPHGAFVRLGTPNVVDGVRGTARIQLAAPRIEVAHGARDRFTVTVWIRAHFLPDGGSAPFPEFIHGQVRAEYRLREEFHPRYGMLLNAHVLPEGVSFTSAGPDFSWDAAITAQVVEALRTRFAMTPHPLKQEFQDRKLRALVAPDGTQAVMAPIALGAAPPKGDPATVNRVILDGRDLAVAVSQEYILSLVRPTLDALLASKMMVMVHVDTPPLVPDLDATYRVVFDRATASWGTGTVPGLMVPGGRISLDIAGHAWTPAVLFPNASFTLRHDIWLLFDASTETLALYSAGLPDVDADVNGPFGGAVEGAAESQIAKQANLYVNAAINNAKPMLQATAARKKTLVDQLRSLDDQADAALDSATFTDEGVILRGRISVAPRGWPQVKLGRLADLGGFTAFPSWIPGGRIDEFRWRWNWFPPVPGVPAPAGSPAWGTQTHDDRFLLRAAVSLPGLPPIPGSPEATGAQQAGVVCLTIRGITIHPVTGDDVPVDSEGLLVRIPPCVYFFPPPPPPWRSSIFADAAKLRLFLRVWGTAAAAAGTAGGSGGSARELAVVEASATSGARSANTLIHYFDEPPAAESLAALAEGTAAAARPDAGLLVVVLLREGVLHGAPEVAQRLAEAAGRFAVPLLINEDVRGVWSERLELPRGRGGAMLLLAPDGSIALRGEGPVDADALAAGLREAIAPAPWPVPEPLVAAVEPGMPAPDFHVEPERAEGLHLRRLQGRPVLVCFVQPWAESSRAQAERLERQREQMGGRGAVALLVVDGLDVGAAAEWGRIHAPSLWAVADPLGAVASAYGVRIWPTTVLVDERGIVAAAGAGTDPGAAAMRARAEDGTATAG